jgi:hypothetical protein
MSRKMIRVVVALALVTLTATGSAHAAGRSLGVETSSLSAAWEWIAGWFRAVPEMSALIGQEGSSMDPNGGTGTNAVNPGDPDEGSQMDPNGR